MLLPSGLPLADLVRNRRAFSMEMMCLPPCQSTCSIADTPAYPLKCHLRSVSCARIGSLRHPTRPSSYLEPAGLVSSSVSPAEDVDDGCSPWRRLNTSSCSAHPYGSIDKASERKSPHVWLMSFMHDSTNSLPVIPARGICWSFSHSTRHSALRANISIANRIDPTTLLLSAISLYAHAALRPESWFNHSSKTNPPYCLRPVVPISPKMPCAVCLRRRGSRLASIGAGVVSVALLVLEAKTALRCRSCQL